MEEFLRERPRLLHDYKLLKGLPEGVDMILQAIQGKKNIVVYGDYDADGVTSVVVLLTVIKAAGGQVSYYIPHRFDEGYGMNRGAVQKLAQKGTNLIITVDCGCTAVQEVALAKELGMEVLITDHHNCGEELPDAVLINPRQPGCPYPFKALAGCGVAFKLALALRDALGLPKQITDDLLDVVAIGTVADVMPLVDENRTIVKYGLWKIGQRKRPGLVQLCQGLQRGTDTFKAVDIAFGIGPCINAAGRMAEATLGVKLLTAQHEAEAKDLAQRILRCNTARKRFQEESEKTCLAMEKESIQPYLFPVLEVPGTHEGINGIVAGKLRERFQKPFALLTPGEDGYWKGTCRSVEKLDLYELLSNVEDLFEKFGGHRAACGFTIAQESIPELRESLQDMMAYLVEEDPALLEPEYHYDLIAPLKPLTPALCQELEKLEPCGQGNPTPRFLIQDVQVVDIQPLGADGKHAALLLGDASGCRLRSVYWNVPGADCLPHRGQRVTVIGRLSQNVFRQRVTAQLTVDAILKE